MRRILTLGQTHWVNNRVAACIDTQVEKYRGNGKKKLNDAVKLSFLLANTLAFSGFKNVYMMVLNKQKFDVLGLLH